MLKKVKAADLRLKMEAFLEKVARLLGIKNLNEICLLQAFQQMHKQLTMKKHRDVNEQLLTLAEVN